MTKETLSRRHFLGAAAATAAAGAAAPALAASTNAPALPAKWDIETDVVVLGCGGAGMMAACQVVDAGKKVEVFDAGVSPYHTATNLCGGLFTACGSKLQKADPSIKDSWEAFAEDIMAYGNYMSLKEPVYGFTKHSGEAFDWLADHGLPAHHLEPYAGHTHKRAHRQETFKGRDYIDTLVKQLAERKIVIRHKCGLSRIFFDPAENRVVGVECGKGDKKVTCRARLGIIMATGGITGSPESLDRWVPSVAGKGVAIGGPNNDGTAMMIAVRDVGVPLSHMQYIASYPCGIVVNGRNGPYCRWWFITNNGGILVNKNGKRFITEKEGICHVTPHLAHNPDGCHYVLADQAGWERTLTKIKLSALVGLPSWTAERIEAEFKAGKNLWKCDTIEELCEKSGVNLEGLKAQIATWNKAVETKNDTQFGRTDQQWKIGKGPYYMIRMFPWNNLSCGGVRVTEHFEVLGWDMKPVKGFYAAGETVAGVHGAFYCGGNACGFAHTSGYMAGKYITGHKEA
ncbi:MAG: FAD-binding protein [Sutterella sp.]|nr:FAD-binding protein [Sutterella sp.]